MTPTSVKLSSRDLWQASCYALFSALTFPRLSRPSPRQDLAGLPKHVS